MKSDLHQTAPAPPILLVEDDPDLGQSTKILLEMVGYEVDWALTAADATSKIIHSDYAVVLLDLRLGKDDGAEMIREARAAGYHIPPVIIVSAEPDERLRSSRALACAVGTIGKPYSLAELNNALKNVLGATG